MSKYKVVHINYSTQENFEIIVEADDFHTDNRCATFTSGEVNYEAKLFPKPVAYYSDVFSVEKISD
jgi:hypothetical protein